MSDAEIEAAIASDPDEANIVWGDDWSGETARPPKAALSIRLDPDVVDFFKKDGKGYQTRINAVLRAFVKAQAGK